MKRSLALFALPALAALLLAGCPDRTEPLAVEPPVLDAPLVLQDPDVPPAREMPVGLSGDLTVGVPHGVLPAYRAARDVVKPASPELEFTEESGNIGPLVRDVVEGRLHLDVLLSVGDRELQPLVQAGLVDGDPVPFIRHAMHLAVQSGNPLGIHSLEDLAQAGVTKVAVPAPQLSLGFYAQRALETAGVWEDLVDGGRVVRPDQPVKARQMIFQGEVDAALVYGPVREGTLRDGEEDRTLGDKADLALVVPRELYGDLVGVAAVLKTARDPDLAHAFVQALRSPEAQAAVEEWGYARVDE